MGIALLSLFCFLTGFGSCSAFSASIKTGMSTWQHFIVSASQLTQTSAASNFPDHRGTATAFPLAAFGLSALFWSTVSAVLFKDDTGRFLLLLSLGTFFLNMVSIPFLKIMPPTDEYQSLAGERAPAETRRLRKHRSSEMLSVGEAGDAGAQSSTAFESQSRLHVRSQSSVSNSHMRAHNPDLDETSSLVSKTTSRHSRDFWHGNEEGEGDALSDVGLDSPHQDVRGLAMLPRVEFWQLFLTMALLSGIGLMTIKFVSLSVSLEVDLS